MVLHPVSYFFEKGDTTPFDPLLFLKKQTISPGFAPLGRGSCGKDVKSFANRGSPGEIAIPENLGNSSYEDCLLLCKKHSRCNYVSISSSSRSGHRCRLFRTCEGPEYSALLDSSNTTPHVQRQDGFSLPTDDWATAEKL